MSRSRDVLHLLARSRPARLDPPPDRAGHDARAASAIVAEATPTVVHERRRPTRTRMAVLTSVGVTAAVVAVAVAGVAIAPRDTPPGTASGSGATSASQAAPGGAGGLLLAAAERSAKAPSSGGRYLTLQSEYGFATPVTAAHGTYTMIEKSTGQYWLARPGAGPSWVMSQSLGAVPATPADEQAWRRAGSPTAVSSTKPKPHRLSTAPGKLGGNTIDGANVFALGDRNASQAQLDALPTDPSALRRELLSRFDGGGGDMPTDRMEWLLGVAAHVVVEMPVSNRVRAAAYRLIAQLPGVRELGTVRDVRGRTGQAVAFTQDSPVIGSFEVRLIIDPDTGQALGRERRAVRPLGPWSWIAPGALSSYELVLVSQRTDDTPPKVDVTN